MLLSLLSHKGTYTLSTTSTFISVYCMLHVLAFVECRHKGLEKYFMIFSIQRCRMIIYFSQQPKHATNKTLIKVLLWFIIIYHNGMSFLKILCMLYIGGKHGWSIFENRVLRVISGAKREFWETGENCILGSFLTKYYYGDLIIWRWGGWISYEWRH